MIKAVIFDMDGLLLDNEPIWRAAHSTVLAKRGLTVTEDDVREMAGKGTLDIVGLWRERFSDWEPEEDVRVCQEIFDEIEKSVKMIAVELPGVTSLVTALNAKSIPMAVASSSPAYLIQATLKKLQLDKLIPVAHSGVDEAHPKPAPDVYLSAAKSLEVQPKNCLVFEDSPSGIKAAKSAGMVCIAVPEPGRNLMLFREADRIISSLAEFDINSL